MTKAPHVERMETELSDLTDRAEKLDAFIASNPAFNGLSSADQELMTQQLGHMRAYEGVLSMRLQLASDSGDNSPPPPHP